MKRKINYIYIVILASALIIGCDNFLEVNTDPTRLKSALITQTLTSAEASLSFYMGSDIFLYSSIFTQQASGSGVTGSQTRQMDQYIVANSDVNNAFSNFYAGSLADLNYIKQNSIGNPQYAGVAKLLQAYTFSILVDAWGDVPYKDALKGVTNLQPAYDDSKEIYDSLFVLIDGAIANVKQASALTMGTEDVIYGGDMGKWERFGNTLKLRLALHYAKVDAGAKLKAIIAAGGPFMGPITAANPKSDNFQMSFFNVTNRQNPINQFELQRSDYYAPAKYIIDLMNVKVDPRRPVYFTPLPFDVVGVAQYKGFDQGASQTAPNSRIHTYLRGAVSGAICNTPACRTPQGAPTAIAVVYEGAAPQRMLTFAEYNFIRAEAALIYGAGTAAEAQTFYAAGIAASHVDAGVTSANTTAYVNTVYADYGGAIGTLSATPATALRQIIEEKYVANYGVAVEPWSDWRRTGFPNIPVSLAAIAQGNNTIPRILVYPLSEQQANGTNVPARASMSVKGTFWDK